MNASLDIFELIENRVIAWCKKTGSSDPTGFMLKLVEETGELAGCHVKDKSLSEKASEAADVFICLLAYCHAERIDLPFSAHEKMSINERRKGRLNRFGVFVKEADLG